MSIHEINNQYLLQRRSARLQPQIQIQIMALGQRKRNELVLSLTKFVSLVEAAKSLITLTTSRTSKSSKTKTAMLVTMPVPPNNIRKRTRSRLSSVIAATRVVKPTQKIYGSIILCVQSSPHPDAFNIYALAFPHQVEKLFASP